MTPTEYFLFLLDKAFVYDDLWPLTLLLLALVELALYKNYTVDRKPFCRRHLLALVPFIFPVFFLVWGTLFEHTQSPAHNIPAWQVRALSMAFEIQVAISGASLAYLKEVRLSVAALGLFQVYLSLYPWNIAEKSVTGDWF